MKAGGDALTYEYGEGENKTTQTVRVNPNFIRLTDTPSTSVEALTATPYSIREDAGSKEVTLEITLKNAVSTDETVILTIDLDGSDDLTDEQRYDGSVDATRDIEYSMNPPSISSQRARQQGRRR